jgi:deoxyribodipyrimidine photolyase
MKNCSNDAGHPDPDSSYIRQWRRMGATYPPPMVEHEVARKRALDAYSKTVKEK